MHSDSAARRKKLARELHETLAHWSFVPRLWKNASSTKHLKWSTPRLWNPTKRDDIPQKPGLYAFLMIPSLRGAPPGQYLLYVGKAERQTLRARYGDYAREPKRQNGRPRVVRMLTTWPKHLWYTYAVTSKQQADRAERALRDALIPPFNFDINAEVNAVKKAFP